ncbi:MAG: hypothetical protein MUF15_23910, partial [Acidobacteria bacterium]|nr:hypothetical protein [Acidobacteriota bacterium]
MPLTELDACKYLARAYNNADPAELKEIPAPDVVWNSYTLEGIDIVWGFIFIIMDLMVANNTPWPAEVVKAKVRKECTDDEPLFGLSERDCVLLFPAWGDPKPMLLVVSAENDLTNRIDICDPDHFILTGNTEPPKKDYRLKIRERVINEKGLTEYEAVVAYAQACNQMDPTDFIELLSPYAHLYSAFPKVSLSGKEVIAKYLIDEMGNMIKNGTVLHAEVVRRFDDIKYMQKPPE